MRVHGICSYNGNKYSGWQKQVNFSSIQEEIEKVLSRVLNTEITIQGSGRTDALVHANNQHFHFDISSEKKVDLDKLIYSMNSLLPRDIKIKSLIEVNDDFHARFSAKEKEYIYKICFKAKDPFLEGLVYFYPHEFSINSFEEALQLFVGTHNYQNFTSKEDDEQNFVRTINNIELKKDNDLIEIKLNGNGFMRYEIRFIIGACLAFATGEIEINYIKQHLKDDSVREIIRYKVPGEGLYLNDVKY